MNGTSTACSAENQVELRLCKDILQADPTSQVWCFYFGNAENDNAAYVASTPKCKFSEATQCCDKFCQNDPGCIGNFFRANNDPFVDCHLMHSSPLVSEEQNIVCGVSDDREYCIESSNVVVRSKQFVGNNTCDVKE